MEVTGYVNCKGSAYTKYTPNNLVHGWEGGTTTQKNIEYDANRNVKIVSQVCPLPEKANTTYTIVFAGKFNYFEGTGYANPDSRNFRVSTIFWPWEN